MDSEDNLLVITTSPNRYKSYEVETEVLTIKENLKIFRIQLPNHTSSMFSQAFIFSIFFLKAIRICFKEKPDYLIGTSGRLMTAILTWIASILIRKPYAIDLRDIFSETISDIFSKKNIFFGKIFNKIFSHFDRWVLTNANCVNIVSKGFSEYFEEKGIDTSKWLFYPNGIDDIFLQETISEMNSSKTEFTILYCGNIGYAQGLDKIVPHVAKKLGHKYRFIIIGDGSAREELNTSIKELNIKNVTIINPVNRQNLLKYYRQSDILFLHLDEVPAFKRVLPSKLFEYAAMGKPIVAGIEGYSSNFVKDNIPYSLTFKPGQIDQCVRCVIKSSSIVVQENEVNYFINNFSRKKIMKSFAADLLKFSKNKI
ncbi:glycosyltransferase family 4 protein [Candidatus Pseudothioglobus singularis]|nr:glycosyltransferase family 4 protein [Candidatus Pseudothioglobus singularis]